MSITLKHPGKGSQVTVPDAVAESYISQGWVVPGSPAPAEQDSADKPSKKWNKDKLTAYATEHGIDLTDAKTKDDILALIVAAALTDDDEDADDESEEDEDADADTGETAAVPAGAVDGADD